VSDLANLNYQTLKTVPFRFKLCNKYTYDDNGNIATIITEGSILKATYTYDELNQMTREDNVYINKSLTYTYDLGGNITYVKGTRVKGTCQGDGGLTI